MNLNRESLPLLTSGSWYTPYQSDADDTKPPEVTSYNGAYGTVEANINVSFSDSSKSSNYDEYSDRDVREGPRIYPVYKKRWYLLLVLCLAVTIQNAVWSTWGPIAQSAKTVYEWDTTMLTVMINCGNVGVLLPVFFTGYLVSKKGLRVSMLTCTLLLAVGAGLRISATKEPDADIVIGIGQFLNGVAGSITQVIPPALSETWFPSNERTTATALAVVANSLGTLVSFMLGPFIVTENTSPTISSHIPTTASSKDVSFMTKEIQTLAAIEFGVAGLLFVLSMVYFPSKPPSPPSPTAATDRHNFTQGLRSVFKRPGIVGLCVAAAVPWAVFANWMGLLSENLHGLHISQKEAGLLGLCGSAAGIVGGIVVGRFADRFPRRLKKITVTLLMLALGTSVWITCIRQEYIIGSHIVLRVQLSVAIVILSAVMYGMLPLCYEMICETGYPAHEGLLSTILSFFINTSAVIFLMVELIGEIKDVVWMNWTLTGVIAAAIVAFILLPVRYTRTDEE